MLETFWHKLPYVNFFPCSENSQIKTGTLRCLIVLICVITPGKLSRDLAFVRVWLANSIQIFKETKAKLKQKKKEVFLRLALVACIVFYLYRCLIWWTAPHVIGLNVDRTWLKDFRDTSIHFSTRNNLLQSNNYMHAVRTYYPVNSEKLTLHGDCFKGTTLTGWLASQNVSNSPINEKKNLVAVVSVKYYPELRYKKSIAKQFRGW